MNKQERRVWLSYFLQPKYSIKFGQLAIWLNRWKKTK
jgi:hypothetical protein